jgi:hypothetical protein
MEAMKQIEIIQRYLAEQGLTRYGLLRAINERLGEWGYSNATPYNWLKGEPIDPRRMRLVASVYPAEDWRGKMARELLGAGQ